MKRLNCGIKLDLRKCLICYMLLELFVWAFMTYSAILHGKIFDYTYFETANFVAHVTEGGSNWYYNLMFGHLNLTTSIDQQKILQGEICFQIGVKIINSLMCCWFSEVRHIEYAVCVCLWNVFHIDNVLLSWYVRGRVGQERCKNHVRRRQGHVFENAQTYGSVELFKLNFIELLPFVLKSSTTST